MSEIKSLEDVETINENASKPDLTIITKGKKILD